MSNFKVQNPNEKIEMSNVKSPVTDTDHEHEHESQCQSSKLGIPGKPEKLTVSGGEFGQPPKRHWSEGTRAFPDEKHGEMREYDS